MRGARFTALLGAIWAFGGACSDPEPEVVDAGRVSQDATIPGCEAPEELCAGACVNIDTDPLHCGRCGETCPEGQFCEGGICTAVCSNGLEACGASCVDFMTDRRHCGGCNQSCGGDRTCKKGQCGCPDGYTECNGKCLDLSGDPDNCGQCDRRCSALNICSSGDCLCAGGTRETDCDDGKDNDCDRVADCADPDCLGATRPCSGVCGPGLEYCREDGKFGRCEGGDGSPEICGDGIDQDCSGMDQRMPDTWEPNNSCAECAMIAGTDPAGNITASFDSVDDPVDCFRFEAYDNSYYPESIQVRLERIPAGHDYDIYLYSSQSSCEARMPIAASAGVGNMDESINWSERFATPDSGTYYIRVVRFSGQSCSDEYLLVVNGLN